MVRDNANDFNSNANSTPIEVFQHNWFREGYFKGTVTINGGRHELKFGVGSDDSFLNQNFRYIITDPTQFDPASPSRFSFAGNRPDLEQSAFVQDLIASEIGQSTPGLRWDQQLAMFFLVVHLLAQLRIAHAVVGQSESPTPASYRYHRRVGTVARARDVSGYRVSPPTRFVISSVHCDANQVSTGSS